MTSSINTAENFIGTLTQCWEKAKELGWGGSAPISRVDGYKMMHADNVKFVGQGKEITDKDGNYLYQIPLESPVFEFHSEYKSDITGVEYIYKDKKTGREARFDHKI